MCAGVDAKGEAADDKKARIGQVATQFARDLAAIGAGLPRTHDRHDTVGAELGKQRRGASAEQRPRRVGRVAQAARKLGVMPTAAPAARLLKLGS
jgi:hypothetical protein